MPLVKIQRKGQVTIPTTIRARLGLADGDLLDVKIRATRIVLTPKVVIDRSKSPNADDEYTPEQRRVIDARLAEADEDIRQGRVHGPFETMEGFERSLRETAEKVPGNRKRSSQQDGGPV
jgi:AbrB family looped-hinge helix DNA binding protein